MLLVKLTGVTNARFRIWRPLYVAFLKYSCRAKTNCMVTATRSSSVDLILRTMNEAHILTTKSIFLAVFRINVSKNSVYIPEPNLDDLDITALKCYALRG
jgi:hypothetical protein